MQQPQRYSRTIAGLLLATYICPSQAAERLSDIATLALGWHGEIIAKVDQSYAGWDVEIGDADNDGRNEVLTTGCPDSRLYSFKKGNQGWRPTLLARNLAQGFPGMGLAVKIVDLNRDGRNEVLVGTGQEGHGNALFYVLQTDGVSLTKQLVCRPACNRSGYTHNLAAYDLDHDGMLEVVSAYCGGGEVIRYDIDSTFSAITARKIAHLSGSGEESLIADVDNDGTIEYITSNSFREGRARVEIFEFNKHGELDGRPRLVLDQFDGNKCFYASVIVGDVDNNGKNELIVGWKRKQNVNKGTIVGYRIAADAKVVYTFAYEDPSLDLSYFEKMMCVADADNDGANELVISTRGDEMSEHITSQHLGHVFVFDIAGNRTITRNLVVDFHAARAESSWVAVGDADNDGKNEIVLATGKGDRTKPGVSYVVLVEKQ